MRVAYLSSASVPSDAAHSVNVMKMCQSLARTGNDVTLFGYKGDEDADPFDYYACDDRFDLALISKWRGRFGEMLSLLRIVRQVRQAGAFDMYYGRNPYLLWALRGEGVPYVFEAHSPPTRDWRRMKRLLRPYAEGRILSNERLKAFVCISRALEAEYLRRYPTLDKSKMVVAPSGADRSSRLTSVARENKESMHVGYVGHLYPGKGGEVILEIARLCPWAKFYVIGASVSELEVWRTTAASVSNIEFEAHIPHKEVPARLGGLDILLAPYQHEVRGGRGGEIGRWMSPLKIFEYMAQEKPIVCSNLPVLTEVLSDEATALLVPPDEPRDWARALERLRDDRDLGRRIGRNARREFEARFTWDSRASSVLNIVHEHMSGLTGMGDQPDAL